MTTPAPPVRNGATLLVDALTEHGVCTIFGFPGDTSIALYDALWWRTNTLRHVLARDERHAGFMADAHARTTGHVGVCEAPSGAGAVYLAGGLAEAFAASVPVLAITSDNNRRSAGTAPISEVDQEKLFSACTKWRRTLTRAADIPPAVAEALRHARSCRPGPVALIIPEDVLEETPTAVPPGPSAGEAATSSPQPADELVREVAQGLAAAGRPAVLAGGGVHVAGAWHELRELAERACVPVATTIHGKGALDEAHPLSLGVVGNNGARDYANRWLTDCTWTLLVGTRANATDTLGFTSPPRNASVRTAHIESDPTRVAHNYPDGVPLLGDAKTILAALAAHVPPVDDSVREHRLSKLAAAREAWADATRRATRSAGLGAGVLHPRDVVRALAETVGRDSWVVADAGTPTPYLASYWEAPGEGWRVVIPRGLGPMGFAMPAAVAVALAHPRSRVLCLTTENSAAMGAAEWETARRLGLAIIYVVVDNTSMSWIKMIQYLYAEARYFAVDPGPVDPIQVAAGMGVPGARVTTVDELTQAVQAALDEGGPVVLHVPVPEHTELVPPVASWQEAISHGVTRRPIH